MGYPTTQPPQRSPAGIATSPPGWLFGDYPNQTPFRVHEVKTDFDIYNAGDWTVTTSGTGSTTVQAASNGGWVTQQTDATATAIQANETPVAGFNVIPGCRMWFLFNCVPGNTFSDATLSLATIQAGFVNTLATMAPTDGIYFEKPAGGLLVNLILAKGGTKTTIPVGSIARVPVNLNNTNMMGFFYDGKPVPTLYAFVKLGFPPPGVFSTGTPTWIGGKQIVASASADGSNPNTLANLPLTTTGLVAGFGLQTGDNVARLISVDYMFAGNEIFRF